MPVDRHLTKLQFYFVGGSFSFVFVWFGEFIFPLFRTNNDYLLQYNVANMHKEGVNGLFSKQQAVTVCFLCKNKASKGPK
jgi:hypothetical protein